MKTLDKVKIRMYRYGLGDCFLLTFYRKQKKPFNILIDCGVLSRSEEYKNKMVEVASNIKQATEGNIDILIATHEHWDHVSGFQQAREIFETIPISKIWMGWTEDPDDEFAKELKAQYSNKLAAVQAAFTKLNEQPTVGFTPKQKLGHQAYLNAFQSFFEFFGIEKDQPVLSLNETGKAMDFLRLHKTAKKEFLTPENDRVIELDELPGVRFYILGPPKNIQSLKKMNPKKDSGEVYELDYGMKAMESFISAVDGQEDRNMPFLNKFGLSPEEAAVLYGEYFNPGKEWRKIDEDWMYSAGNLAIALDSMVNNTCLAMAVELIDTGKVLLFPGDAQIGNWLSWWNYHWNVEIRDKKEKITIEELFKRTVFYKVGHHGSHNATVKDKGLEMMSNRDLIAMIPVDQKMAQDRNWKMPFEPLLKALKEKTSGRVILMDEAFPSAISKANKALKGATALFYDIIIKN